MLFSQYVSEVGYLAKLVKLEDLNLSYNDLTTIAELGGAAKLRNLQVQKNKLRSLGGIEKLRQLRRLHVESAGSGRTTGLSTRRTACTTRSTLCGTMQRVCWPPSTPMGESVRTGLPPLAAAPRATSELFSSRTRADVAADGECGTSGTRRLRGIRPPRAHG